MENTFLLQSDDASIYQVLYDYIVRCQTTFGNIKSTQLSKGAIRRYIERSGIELNGITITRPTERVKGGDLVSVREYEISFLCIHNKQEKTHTAYNSKTDHDFEIKKYLETHLGSDELSSIVPSNSKKAFCYVVMLFEKMGYDNVLSSKYGYEFNRFLKNQVSNSSLATEGLISAKVLAISEKLVITLLQRKADLESEMRNLVSLLLTGQFDQNFYRFMSEYNRLSKTHIFQFLIMPRLNQGMANRYSIENLIKPINDSLNFSKIDEKYFHYQKCTPIYETYVKESSAADEYTRELYSPIGQYFFDMFKKHCDTNEQKPTTLDVSPTPKKYNLKNKDQEIILIVSNKGDGLAKNVFVELSTEAFDSSRVDVGLLKPGERREVSISAQANGKSIPNRISVNAIWEDTTGKQELKSFALTLGLQEADVPWAKLKKQNPYSIQIIEEPSKLYGRDEILTELKENILSNNIESYKIWGQKRVGKSSIVKTLRSIMSKDENIIVVYRRIGGLLNPDPIKTLNDLGECLCSEIINDIDNKIKSATMRENLKRVPIPTFDGSLYPLETFLSKLHKIENELKFIFILDEFDRINDEFFMPGNLGEVLSQSIGKGLNEESYIGFILVGSENMQILDRQGMNYNSYREREVDTFDRVTEYTSFKNIIIGPVQPFITFSEEAIDKVYDATNGNPYFANLICHNVFSDAYKNQDSYIDGHSVKRAIDIIVRSSQKSHFEHFWGDGLTEESDAKKERKTDIRRRILVSYSMSARSEENYYPTKRDILRHFKYPHEYEIAPYEVENTITEFFNRKIFFDNWGTIRVKPELFEMWLTGPGKTLIIEGVADLEALLVEREREKEYALKDEELKRISEQFIYKGKRIGLNVYRDYFQQFGGSMQQRRVFKALDSVMYLSQEEINEFFRSEQKTIFLKRDHTIKEGAHVVRREGVEIYTSSTNVQENDVLIDSFKVMTSIKSNKTTKRLKDDADVWKKNNASEIIIIEPIIDDSQEFQDEILFFLSAIKDQTVSVRLVALVATTKVKTKLIKATSSFANFKMILFKEVEETRIKPFVENTELFENNDEANTVYFEVRKNFQTVTRDTIFVLFENICLSKTCPILWCQTSKFTPLFLNTFKTLDNSSQRPEGERRRDRVYAAVRDLSQGIKQYLVGKLKEKASKDSKEDWFIVEYVPKSVLTSVTSRWIEEGTKLEKESYFDFLDYRKIIEHNKELNQLFIIPGEGLDWINKVNTLRRDFAHPEKPAPEESNVQYVERIKAQILLKLQ